MHILYNLGTEISGKKTSRNPRTYNWAAFKEELKQGPEYCPLTSRHSVEIEFMSEFLTTRLIKNAYKNKQRGSRHCIVKSGPIQKRAEVRKLFNLAKR